MTVMPCLQPWTQDKLQSAVNAAILLAARSVSSQPGSPTLPVVLETVGLT